MAAPVPSDFSGGLNTRLLPFLLPANQLQVAQNVVVRNGRLTPLKGLGTAVATGLGAGTWASIHKVGSTWIASTATRYIVPWQNTKAAYVQTGSAVAKWTNGTSTEDLGLAVPTVALVATNAAAGGITDPTAAYVYTWTSALGQESGPSPVSNSLALVARSVSFSALGTPPTGATGWRLYRLVSGVFLLQQTGTTAGLTPVNDTTNNLNLGDPILTEGTGPAPTMAGLAQGTYLAKVGGFSGNHFYQSNSGTPWAWRTGAIDLPDDIIAAAGTKTGWLVLTASAPYWISGEAGYTRLDDSDNVYGCPAGAQFSLTKVHGGWVWWANEGLVMFKGGGEFSLLSVAALDQEDADAISVTGMVGAFTDGEYVLFHSGGSLRCDMRMGGAVFTTGTQTIGGKFSANDGTLYVSVGNDVKVWAAGANLTMTVRTREFAHAETYQPYHIRSAHLTANGEVTAQFYKDGSAWGSARTREDTAGRILFRPAPGLRNFGALQLTAAVEIETVEINAA